MGHSARKCTRDSNKIHTRNIPFPGPVLKLLYRIFDGCYSSKFLRSSARRTSPLTMVNRISTGIFKEFSPSKI